MRYLFTIFTFIVSVLGFVASVVVIFLVTMPDAKQIQGCFTTSMFGVKLCPSDPGYLRLSEVPSHFVQVLLISEDTDFYNHSGFDFHEMEESLKKNFSEGRVARGGSTITQQLAKNAFLDKDKSLLRKLREAYLTYQIERLLNKNQILERYLNIVEFAPKIYGLRAAADFYFKSKPSELTILQSCFLVLLLPNPEKYGQSFRQGRLTSFAKGRMETLLAKMHGYKRIDDDTFELMRAQIPTFDWKRHQDDLSGAELTEETFENGQSESPPSVDPSLEVSPPESTN